MHTKLLFKKPRKVNHALLTSSDNVYNTNQMELFSINVHDERLESGDVKSTKYQRGP